MTGFYSEASTTKRSWRYLDTSERARIRRRVKVAVVRAINDSAEIHQVTADQILGRKRHPNIVAARQEAMLMAREAGLSYPDIGQHMDRDHTTVMHGVKAASERLCPDPIFKTVRTKQ